MDPGGRVGEEELGVVEGRKIVIRVYYMRKGSIYIKGEKNQSDNKGSIASHI